MSKQTEALKLALEALENTSPLGFNMESDKKFFAAITAIREALAEQETVLPGGGHVPAVPVAVYGYCPECGGAGVMRERRPNGDDKCTNGHKYPSSKALAEQPAQQEPVATVTSESGNPNVSMSWWHEPALPVGTLLYTSPPASNPLTDEEIEEIWEQAITEDNGRGGHLSNQPFVHIARAIEAAHGIKGEA